MSKKQIKFLAVKQVLRQIFLAGVLILSVSACVQQQQLFLRFSADPKGLTTWLDQKLSPYLTKHLAKDPRFRDQSMMLVRLNGSEVQPEIDRLTRQIRRQIKDDLLSTQGIRLSWQSLKGSPKHHRRLSSVQCRQSTDSNYYIGIEITPILSGRHRVSVRAVDISERQWISGFGMSWQGQLTPGEQHALTSLSVDEALRGLRALPFTTQQTDMAADYLANNVSCLLQQQDEDQLLIHVQPAADKTAYMDKLLKLVANNLSRYHELSITDQATKADYVLTLEALKIKPGLDQVWTAISRKHTNVRLSGMDTSTYIQRPSTRNPSQNRNSSAAPAVRQSSRRLSRNSYRGNARFEGCNSCTNQGMRKHPAATNVPYSLTPRRAAAEPANPRPEHITAATPQIKHIRITNSSDSTLCSDTSGHCAILTIDASAASDLYVIQHHAPARLAYLYPANCSSRVQSLGSQSRRHQLPVDRLSGETTYYAIGVNRHSQGIIAAHLSRLPQSCMDSAKSPQVTEIDRWLVQLDHIMQQQQRHISWAATRISF